MLQELLKEYLTDDAKVNEFLGKMKEQKIYTSKEENMDTRYPKLKADFDDLSAKNQESLKLIEELKKSNGDNEGLQAKIKEYEGKVAELTKENEALTIDNSIKFGLLSKGAKASDIDYLIFKIKQSDDELKLDKDGNVKGLDHIIEDLQKTCSSNFEDKASKKVDVKVLPNNDPSKNTITAEQFKKMGYKEKVKLYQENKELYDELSQSAKEDSSNSATTSKEGE